VRAFPSVRGLLPRNLQTMRTFAEAWPEREIVQQLVARFAWGQNDVSLCRPADDATGRWHAERV
jgi:hypothetical protein